MKELTEFLNKSIISKHNYTPNPSARALVNRSSRIIGVINHLIRSQPISFFQDPFHGALLGGIEKKLRERGYYMMVRTVVAGIMADFPEGKEKHPGPSYCP